MSVRVVKARKTTLRANFSPADSELTLQALVDSKGNELAMASFGEWGAVVVKQGTTVEIVKFDDLVQNANGSATLTVATNGRDVSPIYPYAGGATGENFLAGAEVIVTNDPYTMSRFGCLDNANTWDEVQTFAQVPLTTGGNAVTDNGLVRKLQLDQALLGITTTVKIIVEGTAGQNVSAGNLLYLSNVDGKWYKADADSASSSENVILGIAQGAGVTDGAIASGVLLRGTDSNQTGLTAGIKYYVSNTAGEISSSAGTKEVTVGISKSTTELYFDPRFDQQLTEDQQDAIAGANSPSASNVFLTTNDSSDTPSANKLAKYDANGNLPATLMKFNYPLGEAFTGATTPQPAVVIDDLCQPLYDGVSSFGASGSPQHAVKIIPRQTSTIASLITLLTRTTDPSTNLSIEIQTDNAGAPSGTPVTNGTSATIATSTLKNNEYRYFNFTFATPPSITAGTTYWVVFKTSATNANQISVATLTNAKKYGSFSGSTYNGTTWSANQTIPYFEMVCATGGSKSLWVSDANGNEPLGNFHGFCTTTGSAGDTGVLVKQGVAGGFSSLAVGSDYFISTTVGTITLNKNEGVYVGTAVSASTILMPAVKRGQRSTNFYTTILTSGEAGNAFYSVPIYAYEDGVFTLYGTAGMKNNARAYLYGYVMVTHANATSPASAGDVVDAIQTFDNTDGQGGMTFVVKKGDRIQVAESNAGGAGNAPSISKITFVPSI